MSTTWWNRSHPTGNATSALTPWAMLVVVCACFFLSGETQAQNPPQSAARPRWGLAAAVGAGAGASHLSCVACAEGGGLGPAGFGRIGGMYRSDLVVALQVDWWTTTRTYGQDARARLWTTNLALQWYPSAASKWFVDGGLGVGFAESDVHTNFSTPTVRGRGLGYQLGVGYDIPIGTHVWFAPYTSVFGVSRGAIANSQEKVSGTAAQLGIGLSWR